MKTLNLKLKSAMLFIALLAALLSTACNEFNNNPIPDDDTFDSGDFQIIPKYDSIRTYPDGGGIYVVRISPDAEFSGDVNLTLDADPLLNAKLTKTVLTKTDTIVEITIHPSANIDYKTYYFELRATHGRLCRKYQFKALVYVWQNPNSEPCLEKLNLFKSWIQSQKPEFASIFDTPTRIYMTYPEILIVEHWTLINAKYEIRFCFHVMIPPNDWSKIQIRKLGKWEPEFSAHRDSYGKITIIPNSEYPTFLGY